MDEIRTDVTYDNIKSHKKPRLHPFSIRCIIGKNRGGLVKFTPPSSCLRVNRYQIGLEISVKSIDFIFDSVDL